MQRDSIQNTIFISVMVCAVCSLVVSIAAVTLRPLQNDNKEKDRQRNILQVAGFDERTIEDTGVGELFGLRIKDIIIDLETGEDVTSEYTEGADSEEEARAAVAGFDQFKAPKTKKKDKAEKLSPAEDIATIKWQENHSHVYLLMSADGETIEKYIFPVRGYGLWSTLYGFICLESDLNTIAGLTFYEHGETPGLGGEVDNPIWKRIWAEGHAANSDEPVRLKVYDEKGDVAISVAKGQVNASDDMAKHKVDGLSGATITSNGVSNLLEFWMSDSGFKKYIEQNRSSGSESQQSNRTNAENNTAVNTNPAVNSKGRSDG